MGNCSDFCQRPAGFFHSAEKKASFCCSFRKMGGGGLWGFLMMADGGIRERLQKLTSMHENAYLLQTLTTLSHQLAYVWWEPVEFLWISLHNQDHQSSRPPSYFYIFFLQQMHQCIIINLTLIHWCLIMFDVALSQEHSDLVLLFHQVWRLGKLWF